MSIWNTAPEGLIVVLETQFASEVDEIIASFAAEGAVVVEAAEKQFAGAMIDDSEWEGL